MTSTTTQPAQPGTTDLAERYLHVRARTESLAHGLSAEDQTVQSMPDTSPTKWHRAHVTWFFETFILGEHDPSYRPFDPAFAFLFNSYYEAAGPRHTRAARGMITRPGIEEIAAYRRHVDTAMADFLTTPKATDVADLVVLGLHHEQQHQELLLMDIKHLLAQNPTGPLYHAAEPSEGQPTKVVSWHRYDGGIVDIGYDGDAFCFDNELPRHQALVPSFEIADRLVTAGEWLEFIDDGGYQQPQHWLSDGWHTVNNSGWQAPEYWRRVDDAWHVFTLSGFVPVDPATPVCHLSYYEADAFASWSGARLPTEFEWELAATDAGEAAAPSRSLHPEPAHSSNDRLHQMYDCLWQWTSSPYTPYPGFRAAPGAVGEYNGKFMVNTWVLRGGCVATPADHARASYRNFFHPATRWHFSGLRLARDV